MPYSLTEEFVAVYRMHPLHRRTSYAFRSVDDDRVLADAPFADVASDRRRRYVTGEVRLADLFYSFGVAHPGAITPAQLPPRLQDSRARTGRLDLPRSTSCGTASAACRATTSSAGCCTCRPATRSRS